MLIRVSVILAPLRLENLNNGENTKWILEVVVKWRQAAKSLVLYFPIKRFQCGLVGVFKQQEMIAKKNSKFLEREKKMFKNTNMAAVTSIGHF